VGQPDRTYWYERREPIGGGWELVGRTNSPEVARAWGANSVVDFAGRRMRPDLAAEAVELELMTDALERGARHHAEHGPTAACGCPARIDGTDPYLHRDGCPRQGELQVQRWLAERGDGGGT
jgi:hypothetical protein